MSDSKHGSRLSTKLVLGAIILLALVVRVGFVSTLEEDLYWPDPTYYDAFAWNLITGESLSGEPLYDAVKRAPLQAFLMTIPYAAAGHSYRAAYFFQAVLGGLFIPLLAFLIGVRLKSAGVGLVTALLAAVYPYYIYISGALYATQTSTILLLLVVYLAVRASQTRGVGVLILQGVSLGALVLTRSIGIILLPLSVLWTWPKRGITKAVIVALVAVVVVAPWTIRNYNVTGEIIAVSVGGGREFLHGVAPGATGTSQSRTPLPGDLLAIRSTLPQGEWDKMCYQRGFEFIKADPVRFVKLYGAKFLNLYRFYPNTITTNEHTSSTTMWISIISSGPVLLLGLAGIWLERRRWMVYLPVLSVIVGFSFVYSAFTTCIRYRLPIDVYFMLFAAVALGAIAGKLGGRLGRFFDEAPTENAVSE